MKNTYISKDYDRIVYRLGQLGIVICGIAAVLIAVSVLVS